MLPSFLFLIDVHAISSSNTSLDIISEEGVSQPAVHVVSAQIHNNYDGSSQLALTKRPTIERRGSTDELSPLIEFNSRERETNSIAHPMPISKTFPEENALRPSTSTSYLLFDEITHLEEIPIREDTNTKTLRNHVVRFDLSTEHDEEQPAYQFKLVVCYVWGRIQRLLSSTIFKICLACILIALIVIIVGGVLFLSIMDDD